MARKRYPDYLTKEEVTQFMSVINNTRDKLIIRLMLECGLRVSEVVGNDELDIPGLRPIDIDRINKRIRVRGKGDKERYVPIKPNLLGKLIDYIEKHNIGPYDRIFKITPRRVEQIVKKYAQQAGIIKRVHPHTFRHTFAVMCIDSGMPVTALQQLLGHASITTTQVYTEIAMRELSKYYQQYAPDFE